MIAMYPRASTLRSYPDLPSGVPDPLRRSLISTIDAFNTKNFAATAVCGRRTLEAIFKYRLPAASERNLATLIDAATKQVDFGEPLRTLAHAIRSGGNLGAHFDPDNEPSENVARDMVELLEYLISYLYVLPQKIGNLESSLGKD
jgi:hypothetical protein